jgi:phage baseplate assembly protein gpV
VGETLPTFLEMEYIPLGRHGSLADGLLRLGEVIGAFPPGAPNNQSPGKKQWEYLVSAWHRNGQGPLCPTPYRCSVMDSFGGMADHLRHTVRMSPVPPEDTGVLTKGSMVLVLCPNGDKTNAVIIGGVRHHKEQTSDPDDTFLDFLFNGLGVTINADGELRVQIQGATKADGTAADTRDENNKGSFVSFDKAGNITISDANGETVTISPKDKSITVAAGAQTTTVEKAWKLKAGTVLVEADEVTIDSGKVQLGGKVVNPLDEVVIGSGIDPFTGVAYKALGSTSSRVKAKK